MEIVSAKILWVLGGCAGLAVVVVVVIAGFVLLGSARAPFFAHLATSDLFETHDLDAPKLAPFTAHGVTVAGNMAQGRAEVKLSFASKSAGTFTLERLTVTGRGADPPAPHAVEVGDDLTLTPSMRGPVHKAHRVVRLGLSPADYDALGADGYHVTVALRVGDHPSQTITLLFDRTDARVARF